MPRPNAFSWISKPGLAALGRPAGPDDLQWLRDQGVDLLVSLTEEPLPRRWVNDAGLMALHVPVEDMTAPTTEQFGRVVDAIERAHRQGLGAAIHCAAGLGRTGAVVAAYLVTRGRSADEAIEEVRRLRPGSIETPEQARAVEQFARARHPEAKRGAR